VTPVERDSPHLPNPAPIESYRGGGFRFGGMSHRGALLCLPDGMWASAITRPQDIDETALRLVLDCSPPVELCVIGGGRDPWMVPPALRACCREAGFSIEGMTTPAAVHTYNILVEERRRIAALLIPLD
jgi:uncharacterized protein